MSKRRKSNSRRRGATARTARRCTPNAMDARLLAAPTEVHACLLARSDLFGTYEQQISGEPPEDAQTVTDLVMDACFGGAPSRERTAEIFDGVGSDEWGSWYDHSTARLGAFDDLKESAASQGFELASDEEDIFKYHLVCSHDVCERHGLHDIVCDSPYPSLDLIRTFTDND